MPFGNLDPWSDGLGFRVSKLRCSSFGLPTPAKVSKCSIRRKSEESQKVLGFFAISSSATTAHGQLLFLTHAFTSPLSLANTIPKRNRKS